MAPPPPPKSIPLSCSANRSLRATRTINEIDAFVRRLASFDRLFALKLLPPISRFLPLLCL
ncbi:hypothetical protein PCANC_21823 [Puccinia coronata f. sp. avenae]|uniref:Uncharacterized protein n=1 Tax=Puccinia coronata f. sp. avenae TaxID=200324 RepID=A0A2N5SGA2_9BASI|nr:hypothetical protein PCANC_21823 [Puccinia coronata f. sp. avenae]